MVSIPASRAPVALLAVDRAVSEIRRGRTVVVHGNAGAAIGTQAAEAVTDEGLDELARLSHSQPTLSITARRARVLGLADTTGKIVTFATNAGLTAKMVGEIADPLVNYDVSYFNAESKETPNYDNESAAVILIKIARLLPAAVTATLAAPDADDIAAWASRYDLLLVDAGDIFQYENTAAKTLRAVSDAWVPLTEADNTRIIAFRPLDGGLEHLAIVIGDPNPAAPVLTRLHSECFTGDLLGSLRCDCGDQLQGAIKEIAAGGTDVLLCLAQEGRDIGLVNKLRAYGLQDRGFDTIDANEQLGFDADERVYLPATQMLLLLGYKRIRLMTNNPEKVSSLARCSVIIDERVPHSFPSNRHNETYLRTKAARGGHLI